MLSTTAVGNFLPIVIDPDMNGISYIGAFIVVAGAMLAAIGGKRLTQK